VETADGRVFTGCNVENASYGLTVCAERVAVFTAVAAGALPLRRIAVTCPRGDEARPESLMPCGACLQVLREFLPPDAWVLVDGVGTFRLEDLLPRPFHL
jgi:cytidine deaminase